MTNLAHLPPTVNELIIIEELWRDEYEIGYLATTGPTLCTIKYIDTQRAQRECELWHTLHPEFKDHVRVEKWSKYGKAFLLTPHFCLIPKDRREAFLPLIESLLREKYVQINCMNDYVRWNTIGIYLNDDGIEIPVVFNLISAYTCSTTIQEQNSNKMDMWVVKCMKTLRETM